MFRFSFVAGLGTVPSILSRPGSSKRFTHNCGVNTKRRYTTDTDGLTGASHKREPIDVINHLVRFCDSDHQFWWDKAGAQLAVLLRYAGYEKVEQYNELLFFAIPIIPELGLVPDDNGHLRWHSPHTPDGTPLGYSWE